LTRKQFGNPEHAPHLTQCPPTLGATVMVRSTTYTIAVLLAVLLGFILGAAEAMLAWRH
jgi:hypothetical protein